MSLDLELSSITDLYIRENFKKLETQSKIPLLDKPLKFLEIEVPCATANFKFPHNLDYTPKDMLVTSKVGTGDITINYSLFDGTNINLTSTGSSGDTLTIRCLLGTLN